MMENRSVRIVPQTTVSFSAGLTLYRARLDKGYSLTDCISMEAMRHEGITDVLTNDGHFEQEGFRALASLWMIWMNWPAMWRRRPTTQRSRNWKKSCTSCTFGLRRCWTPIRTKMAHLAADRQRIFSSGRNRSTLFRRLAENSRFSVVWNAIAVSWDSSAGAHPSRSRTSLHHSACTRLSKRRRH
jgi:hypothetical protein